MFHTLELVSIIILIVCSEGVLQPESKPASEIAWSLLKWIAVFGIGIALLSTSTLAAIAVRVGLLALCAYAVRWMMDEVAGYLRGPRLIEAPNRRMLELFAKQAWDLSEVDAKNAARTVISKFDTRVVLLGLMATIDRRVSNNFQETWFNCAQQAYEKAVQMAAPSGGRKARAADIAFVVEAMCLYEPSAVEQAAKKTGWAGRGRSGRSEIAAVLKERGRFRTEAVRLGLAPAASTERDDQSKELSFEEVAWPAGALKRAGFARRANLLALCHGLLYAYGLSAVLMGRGSGWVFLCAGILIHVQAAFAIGDFRWLSDQSEPAGGEGQA